MYIYIILIDIHIDHSTLYSKSYQSGFRNFQELYSAFFVARWIFYSMHRNRVISLLSLQYDMYTKNYSRLRSSLSYQNFNLVWQLSTTQTRHHIPNQQQVFEGKRHGVHPQMEYRVFLCIFGFPVELSYVYLRFEGNGEIPLGG